MLLSAILGVVSVADTAAEKKLEISLASLSFEDAVYPLFAVDYTAVYADKATAEKNIKINVYKGEKLITTLAPATDLAAPEGTVAFKFTDIGLKNMGDIYTYVAVNGVEENKSAAVEYSVLEYAIKASATTNEKLSNVIDRMIEVGAAAQAAFAYTDYDYDLKSEYGLVVVGGAAEGKRKLLAEIGETFTTEVDEEAFPSGAVLYDLSFNPAASTTVTVTEGVSRYFFFGPDIYGDKHGAYSTAVDHVSTNLDFDTVTAVGTKRIHDSAHPYTNTNNKYWGNRCLTVSSTGVVALNYESNSGWSETGNNRNWTINSTKAGKTSIAGTNYLGGGLQTMPGYFHIDCLSETAGYDAVGYTLRETYSDSLPKIPHDPENFLQNGKFTIGFTLAKQKGVDFSSTSSVCKIFNTDSDYIPLFSINGNKIMYGNTVLAELKEFEGAKPTASDFTSFYLVIDANENTITCHRDSGKSVTVSIDFSKCSYSSSSLAWFTAKNVGFVWNFTENGGEAYINRITYMVGDIFA